MRTVTEQGCLVTVHCHEHQIIILVRNSQNFYLLYLRLLWILWHTTCIGEQTVK